MFSDFQSAFNLTFDPCYTFPRMTIADVYGDCLKIEIPVDDNLTCPDTVLNYAYEHRLDWRRELMAEFDPNGDLNTFIIHEPYVGVENPYGFIDFYTNAGPGPWDVDFSTMGSVLVEYGENATYYLRINAEGGQMMTFDIRVWYDNTAFKVHSCSVGKDWEQYVSAINWDGEENEIIFAGARGYYYREDQEGMFIIGQCEIQCKLFLVMMEFSI